MPICIELIVETFESYLFNIYIYTLYACMYVCLYTCKPVCRYACMNARMHAYACMNACVRACVHVDRYLTGSVANYHSNTVSLAGLNFK